MKEKSSTNNEKNVDYTQTKDAYDGRMEAENYKASYQVEPLPESSRPRKDGPGGE